MTRRAYLPSVCFISLVAAPAVQAADVPVRTSIASHAAIHDNDARAALALAAAVAKGAAGSPPLEDLSVADMRDRLAAYDALIAITRTRPNSEWELRPLIEAREAMRRRLDAAIQRQGLPQATADPYVAAYRAVAKDYAYNALVVYVGQPQPSGFIEGYWSYYPVAVPTFPEVIGDAVVIGIPDHHGRVNRVADLPGRPTGDEIYSAWLHAMYPHPVATVTPAPPFTPFTPQFTPFGQICGPRG